MIRDATEKDLMNILHIYNDAILNSTAVYAYKPQTFEDRKVWFEEKVDGRYPVIVYIQDNKAVGFATFGPFRGFPANKYSVEHSIYVNKEYRKLGIGASLMKALITIATKREYKTLIAGIDAANAGSIAMHKSFDFIHSGTIKNAGFKFNKWIDLAFYQLELNGPENPIED